MATWDDVERIALALPETSEAISREQRQWRVKDKLFVWERPLRRADLEALGAQAPQGPILGARVEHLIAKEALLADDSDVYFTTPHFEGYPAVLVQLERIGLDDLQELIVEAWLARAPKRLARERSWTSRSARHWKPSGLERLVPGGEVLDPHHHAVAEGRDLVVELLVDRQAAAAAATVVAQAHRDAIACVDRLLRARARAGRSCRRCPRQKRMIACGPLHESDCWRSGSTQSTSGWKNWMAASKSRRL